MMVIGGRGQGRRVTRLVLSSSRWLSVAPLLQADWSTSMSEELLRQQSYAIKNQLGHPKSPTRLFLLALS